MPSRATTLSMPLWPKALDARLVTTDRTFAAAASVQLGLEVADLDVR